MIVSIASAIITIIQSGMSAFNYQDKVQTSTELLMKIEKEKLLYITKTSPYWNGNTFFDKNYKVL
ncbi:hypothetical protein EfmJHP38_21640 [Enterococcus faecium]|nr:hypothetical protein EfmJHP38_21640 [Enterococcus faecium]